jgi:molybdate transport system substrate-binding protein
MLRAERASHFRMWIAMLPCLAALTLPPRPAQSQIIDILAAASTTEAVTAIASALKQKHGIKLRPTFAASSTLAKHIAAGAPAHLFLSADLAWLKYLRERNLLAPGGTVGLLGNRLVILHRKGEADLANLAGLARALGDGRLIMGDPAHVPAGRYGRQALRYFGLWKTVGKRAVFGASVRGALALLSRGQGRFAIAYASDARAHGNLAAAAAFPRDSHDAIIYPLAIVKEGDGPLVRKAYAFLRSGAAKVIFEQFGFTFLPKPR